MANITRASSNIASIIAGGGQQQKSPFEIMHSLAQTQRTLQETQLQNWKMQGYQAFGDIYATSGSPEEAQERINRSPFRGIIPEIALENTRMDLVTKEISGKNMEMTNNMVSNFAKGWSFLYQNPSPESIDNMIDRTLATATDPVARRNGAAILGNLKRSLLDGTNGDPSAIRERAKVLGLQSGLDAHSLSLGTNTPMPQIVHEAAAPSTAPFFGGTTPGAPTGAAPGAPAGPMQPSGAVPPTTYMREPLTGPPGTAPTSAPGAPAPTPTAPGTYPTEGLPAGSLAGKSPAKLSSTAMGVKPTWGEKGQFNKQVDDAQKLYDDRAKAYESAESNMGNYAEMEAAFDGIQRAGGLFTPGKTAEARTAFIQGINTLYSVLDKKPPFDTSTVAKVEDLAKLYQRAVFDFESSHMGQQRVAFATMEMAAKTMPGIENTYKGAKMMLESLRAANQRIIDRRNFDQQYITENGNLVGADTEFNKRFPARAYAERTLDKFGMRPGGFSSPGAIQDALANGRITPDEAEYARANRGRMPSPKE